MKETQETKKAKKRLIEFVKRYTFKEYIVALEDVDECIHIRANTDSTTKGIGLAELTKNEIMQEWNNRENEIEIRDNENEDET
jgi:hypothetical protein